MVFRDYLPEIIMAGLFVLVIMLIIFFVTSEKQQEAFEKQVLAKQTALMLNNAKPGMEIFISYKDNKILDLEEDKVVISQIYNDKKIPIYSYSFLETFNYNYQSRLGFTKITILEKND